MNNDLVKRALAYVAKNPNATALLVSERMLRHMIQEWRESTVRQYIAPTPALYFMHRRVYVSHDLGGNTGVEITGIFDPFVPFRWSDVKLEGGHPL